jgi:hypothetical protein
MLRTLAFASFVALVAPSGAFALTPLNQEEHINASLMAARVGDIIRKTCPTISPRWFTVYMKAKDLETYARKMGYQEDAVKAFLKNKDEKARVRAIAEAYMAEHGVVAGNVESYCKLGREEIAAGSLIGSLLRSH